MLNSHNSFHLARIPPVHFGPGKLARLPAVALGLGRDVLLVTGARSLKANGRLDRILSSLREAGMLIRQVTAENEPSPAFIDATCASLREHGVQVVIGVGGGSVIDAAKAISAMLPHRNPVLDHLEDVGGNIPHSGRKIPLVAVPTTAGTGGEMTKNAVLSVVGPQGYKKSIRHENLIPDAVVVDPELALSCPPALTAACGLDAFTQLLEAYLSPHSTAFTDALALSGLSHAAGNLMAAYQEGESDIGARSAMAYASMLSGVVLANAGLGIVHGLASPIGGFFSIPHGEVCGLLLSTATSMNIQTLRERRKLGGDGAAWAAEALAKYAKVGELFPSSATSGTMVRGVDYFGDRLEDALEEWTETLGMPLLSKFGVREEDLGRIADLAGNRNNPVKYSREERFELLSRRL